LCRLFSSLLFLGGGRKKKKAVGGSPPAKIQREEGKKDIFRGKEKRGRGKTTKRSGVENDFYFGRGGRKEKKETDATEASCVGERDLIADRGEGGRRRSRRCHHKKEGKGGGEGRQLKKAGVHHFGS